MKAITIDFYGKEADYILLEDINDVLDYAEHLYGDVEIAAERMIKSDLPPERFDHLVANDRVGAMIGGAAYKANILGGAAIQEVCHMANDKITSMSKFALKGEQIMVNKNGGYCFLDEKTKILHSEPHVLTREDTYTIRENTTYINLENDSVLEKHTNTYLSKIDPNYSWIASLRNYDSSELIDIFKTFKANGGSIAYVYTTGFDVPQVHMYCSALKYAGITEVHFEFNAGIEDKLRSALDQIAAEGMNITFLGDYK